jgi:hypothetical protein
MDHGVNKERNVAVFTASLKKVVSKRPNEFIALKSDTRDICR